MTVPRSLKGRPSLPDQMRDAARFKPVNNLVVVGGVLVVYALVVGAVVTAAVVLAAERSIRNVSGK